MGVENGVIKGHQASHDFLGAAKLQSLQGGDNPRYTYASAAIYNIT